MKRKNNPTAKKPKSDKAKGRVLSTSDNLKLPILLSSIEAGFKSQVAKHGSTSILSIAEKAIQELEEMKLPKPTLKICKNKVTSLIKSTVTSSLDIAYTLMQQEDITELQALAIINNPDYTESIVGTQNSPKELKEIALSTIPSFIKKKLEELEITSEAFFSYIEDPSEQTIISRIGKTNPPVISDPEDDVIPEKATFSEIESIITEKPTEIKEDSVITTTSDTTFFEEVKRFTNGFRFLTQATYSEMSDAHMGKFSSFENYLKFKTFQQKLESYMEESEKTEAEVITDLIDKKSDELSQIDPNFIDILNARKEIIEKSFER